MADKSSINDYGSSDQPQVDDISKVQHDSKAVCHPTQAWTLSGYPIVDKKYLDLSTGTLKEIQDNELVTRGPPSVDAFWYNMDGGDGKTFGALHHSFGKPVSEYLSRIGDALKAGDWEVYSMTVTRYSVTIVIQTELSRDKMINILDGSRILGHF